MKTFGKIVTFSMLVGATAAGVYHYLQKKDSELVDADDFDDLDNFEGVKEEPERSYVDLGKAGAKVGEAADKAKAAVREAYEKVKESGAIDKAKEFAGSAYEKVSEKFKDLTSDKKEDVSDEADEDIEVVKSSEEAEETVSEEGDSTEDFFEDKDEA
ncbi:MAG: hypothetical protein K5686_12745 [Lachnospiraceae bacterium]|nr:hypothetical protein [Lachnospiraceae bacterium]